MVIFYGNLQKKGVIQWDNSQKNGLLRQLKKDSFTYRSSFCVFVCTMYISVWCVCVCVCVCSGGRESHTFPRIGGIDHFRGSQTDSSFWCLVFTLYRVSPKKFLLRSVMLSDVPGFAQSLHWTDRGNTLICSVLQLIKIEDNYDDTWNFLIQSMK